MPKKTSSSALAKGGKKPMTQAKRAGIVLPPARILKMMRADRLNQRISGKAAVTLTALLNYITEELLAVTGDYVKDNGKGKKRLTNRHLQLAVSNDIELSKLFASSIIFQGGKAPHIEPALLPKKKVQNASQEV